MTKQKNLSSSLTAHGKEMQYIQEAFDTNRVVPMGNNAIALNRKPARFYPERSYQKLKNIQQYDRIKSF